MNDSNAVLRIKDMTPGAIGVVHLPGREDPTIPLPLQTDPRSPTRITRSLLTLKIYPALTTKTLSIWWPSADNSKNWVFMPRATRERVTRIITRMETIMLTLAFSSLRARSR